MPQAADIRVEAKRSMDGWVADVTVREGSSSTHHRVRVSEVAWQRLTGGHAPVEDLLRESFMFLLEREPKESILGTFEINVIAKYFPEYERVVGARFAKG